VVTDRFKARRTSHHRRHQYLVLAIIIGGYYSVVSLKHCHVNVDRQEWGCNLGELSGMAARNLHADEYTS
jgi:hypothetical protein